MNKLQKLAISIFSLGILLAIFSPAIACMVAMPLEIPALTADLIGVVEITEVSEPTNAEIQLPHMNKPAKTWHKIYTAKITYKNLYANRNQALKTPPTKDKPVTFKFVASAHNPNGPRISINMPEFKLGDKICVMLVKSKNLKHLYLPTYYQNYRNNTKDAKAFKNAANIKIHWSEPKDGIKIGLALKSTKLTTNPASKDVNIQAFILIKNSSDKTVGVCNYPSDNCFSASYTTNNKRYPIAIKHHDAGTGFNEYFVQLLKPGQSQVFSTKAFPGAITGTFKATKGEKIKIQFTYKNSRKASRNKIDAWKGKITTPLVEVEIK